jgi:hypothetical protein
VILVRVGKLTPFMIILRGFAFIFIHITFLAAWYYFLRYF